MTVFVHTTRFSRGEVSEALHDRTDLDIYSAAAKYMENWLPNLPGSIERRPPFNGAVSLPDTFPPGPAPVHTASRPELHALTLGGEEFLVAITRARTLRPGEGEMSSVIYVWAMRVTSPPDAPLEVEIQHDASRELWHGPDTGEPPPMTAYATVAPAGPAAFVTSPDFPPVRFYVDGAGELHAEEVQWFEELLGTVDIEQGSQNWKGEDTLFAEQLSVGDTFWFEGVEYTVEAFNPDSGDPEQTDNNRMRTVETYQGPSIAGKPIMKATTVADAFGGNPHLCAYYRGRLVLAATDDKPTTIWASAAGDPFRIVGSSVRDDSPIEYEVLANGADRFVWMTATDVLHLGATQAEFALFGEENRGLTPTNFAVERTSSVGSAPIPAFQTHAEMAFVSRGRSQLMTVAFDETVRGYLPSDLTVLAPHLFHSPIRRTAYRPATATDPSPRVVVLLEDNSVRVCTLDQGENVASWARLTPGGARAAVRDVVSTTGSLYFLVETGSTMSPGPHWFVTRMAPPREEDYYTMDFTTEVEVLPYGESGARISIPTVLYVETPLAIISEDRGFLAVRTYEGYGVLDVSDLGLEPGDHVLIGLPYRSLLELLPVAVPGDARGGFLNRKRRVVRALVSVAEAYQLFVNDHPLYGGTGDVLGSELPQRTGVHPYYQLGWSEHDKLTIEAASVYRAHILSVTREVNQ